MIINVTQEDIATGQCGNSAQCPIAKAIKRETGLRHVWVSRTEVKIVTLKNGDYIKKIYELNDAAMTFVNRFDSQTPVKPSKFRLRRISSRSQEPFI